MFQFFNPVTVKMCTIKYKIILAVGHGMTILAPVGWMGGCVVLAQDLFTIGRYDIAGLKPLAVFMAGILVPGSLESPR